MKKSVMMGPLKYFKINNIILNSVVSSTNYSDALISVFSNKNNDQNITKFKYDLN